MQPIWTRLLPIIISVILGTSSGQDDNDTATLVTADNAANTINNAANTIDNTANTTDTIDLVEESVGDEGNQTRPSGTSDNSILPLQDSAAGYAPRIACADHRYRSGEDAEDFDFIRHFQLDRGTRFPGIYRIRGSNGVQVAYRLMETVRDLEIPAWQMFPYGVPASFTFLCTYRTRQPIRYPWRYLVIQDPHGRPSLEISVDPEARCVRLLMPHVFNRAIVFDGVPASVSM
ncbi:hypothetical protein M8J77_018306 [Diaphorina citri]|nr:hypothetical protein M8J77_018306 [Diaphorina citri]